MMLILALGPGAAPQAIAQESRSRENPEKTAGPAEVKEIPPPQEEEKPDKPQVSLGADMLSQYVWRGVALSRNSVVFQPSATISYKGLTANFWGNFDTSEQNPFGFKRRNSGRAEWNETDLTLSYSREVLPNLTLTAGFITYLFDRNNSRFDSMEIYGGASYKFPWFEAGFAAYREVLHLPGTYLQWYISRSFELPYYGISIDLSAGWSAELSNDKAAYPIPDPATGGYKNQFYQSLHAGHVMAAINFPLGKYVKFTPKIMYWYALGGQATYVIGWKGETNPGLSWDRQHNHLLGGATLTVTF